MATTSSSSLAGARSRRREQQITLCRSCVLSSEALGSAASFLSAPLIPCTEQILSTPRTLTAGRTMQRLATGSAVDRMKPCCTAIRPGQQDSAVDEICNESQMEARQGRLYST